MLNLDFNLITPQERNEYVTSFFSQNPKYKPTQHELETISNYILFGKEPITKKGERDPNLPPEKWTNISQRKEVNIQTKHPIKERTISLEELKTEPTLLKTKYIKPSFPREENADIPSIQELWATIDLYEALLAQDLSPNVRYQYKHMLIDLRRQQYVLRDIYKPPITIHFSRTNIPQIPSVTIFPTIPISSLNFPEQDADENTITIDFTNTTHIKRAIEFYNEMAADNRNLSAAENIINPALDFYIDYAKLRPELYDIIQLKKERRQNTYIAKAINQKYARGYSSSYISQLYTNAIGFIAAGARLLYKYYLNRNNHYLFKKCIKCGEIKLICEEEFTKKARNIDGFSNQCKECDKNVRKQRKIINQDA